MRAASSVSEGGIAARQMALRVKHSHRAFRFCIPRALDMKLRKRAKAHCTVRGESPLRSLRIPALSIATSLPLFTFSLRRQRVHLVENGDCFQHGAAYNFQALGTELIDGVLRGVPEHVVVAVIEVDEIGGGHASLYEGNVVVFHARDSAREEMRLVA